MKESTSKWPNIESSKMTTHGWQTKSTNKKEKGDAARGRLRERNISDTDKMQRLDQDLSNDVAHYSRVANSISNIEKRIKELDNVLQEATQNIVNISRPSQNFMMSRLAEAKRCRNEAALIKKKGNITDPDVQARITALLAKSADIIEELISDNPRTGFNHHEAQTAMFNISINSMVSNELMRQIVKEMTNLKQPEKKSKHKFLAKTLSS